MEMIEQQEIINSFKGEDILINSNSYIIAKFKGFKITVPLRALPISNTTSMKSYLIEYFDSIHTNNSKILRGLLSKKLLDFLKSTSTSIESVSRQLSCTHINPSNYTNSNYMDNILYRRSTSLELSESDISSIRENIILIRDLNITLDNILNIELSARGSNILNFRQDKFRNKRFIMATYGVELYYIPLQSDFTDKDFEDYIDLQHCINKVIMTD